MSLINLSASGDAEILAGGLIVSTLWVPKIPPLKVLLDLCNTSRGDLRGATHILVRDSSGSETNRITVEFEPDQVPTLDLTLLIGGCKEDSGIQHGTLEVRSPLSYAHFFRMTGNSTDNHSFRGAVEISRTAPYFSFLNPYPKIGENEAGTKIVSTKYFALLNLTEVESEVQCRLYYERYHREVVKLVPPNGVKILRVEDDFAWELAQDREETPKHIRISQKSDRNRLAVQLVEKFVDQRGEETCLSIS